MYSYKTKDRQNKHKTCSKAAPLIYFVERWSDALIIMILVIEEMRSKMPLEFSFLSIILPSLHFALYGKGSKMWHPFWKQNILCWVERSRYVLSDAWVIGSLRETSSPLMPLLFFKSVGNRYQAGSNTKFSII